MGAGGGHNGDGGTNGGGGGGDRRHPCRTPQVRQPNMLHVCVLHHGEQDGGGGGACATVAASVVSSTTFSCPAGSGGGGGGIHPPAATPSRACCGGGGGLGGEDSFGGFQAITSVASVLAAARVLANAVCGCRCCCCCCVCTHGGVYVSGAHPPMQAAATKGASMLPGVHFVGPEGARRTAGIRAHKSHMLILTHTTTQELHIHNHTMN